MDDYEALLSDMTREELVEELIIHNRRLAELEIVTLEYEDSENFLRNLMNELKSEKGELEIENSERILHESALREFANEFSRINRQLKDALDNIKTLTGLLPICSSCKSIRDDKGYWNRLETYIEAHSNARFSHTLCLSCLKSLFPEQYVKLSSDTIQKYAQPSS